MHLNPYEVVEQNTSIISTVYNNVLNATISSHLIIQILEQSGVIVRGSSLAAVMEHDEL